MPLGRSVTRRATRSDPGRRISASYRPGSNRTAPIVAGRLRSGFGHRCRLPSPCRWNFDWSPHTRAERVVSDTTPNARRPAKRNRVSVRTQRGNSCCNGSRQQWENGSRWCSWQHCWWAVCSHLLRKEPAVRRSIAWPAQTGSELQSRFLKMRSPPERQRCSSHTGSRSPMPLPAELPQPWLPDRSCWCERTRSLR